MPLIGAHTQLQLIMRALTHILGKMSPTRMKRLEITSDDSKVLGKTPVRFLRKSADNFTTKNFMTLNSAWTPVVHAPSNEQVSFTLYKVDLK